MDDKRDIPSCHQTPAPDEARHYYPNGEAVAMMDFGAQIKRQTDLVQENLHDKTLAALVEKTVMLAVSASISTRPDVDYNSPAHLPYRTVVTSALSTQ